MRNKQIFTVIRKNVPRSLQRDIYHTLLTMSWWKTIFLFLLLFLLTNAVFATLYWINPGSLAQSDGTWLSCFFFSVETLGTIGYGYHFPASNWAHFLVTLEAAIGIVITAIMAGFFFAKFSRPFAKVEFTDKMIITQHEGKLTLVFRMVNIRENQLIDSTVHFNALKSIRTKEGIDMRKFIDLRIERNRVPLFSMSMNIIHVIDEQSPLFGITPENMHAYPVEFLVTLVGTDGTFGQTVHSSQRYTMNEIVWNKRWADMVEVREEGVRIVDYGHFNEME